MSLLKAMQLDGLTPLVYNIRVDAFDCYIDNLRYINDGDKYLTDTKQATQYGLSPNIPTVTIEDLKKNAINLRRYESP